MAAASESLSGLSLGVAQEAVAAPKPGQLVIVTIVLVTVVLVLSQ